MNEKVKTFCVLLLLLLVVVVVAGLLVSCGSSEEQTVGSLKYIPDYDLISVGNTTSLKGTDLLPVLSTLRYFPDRFARKSCYVFSVIKGGKYLLRTTYYYGGFDGGIEPPVFDQIIEGTKWSIVNTTEDYANGLSSYYEIIVAATGKNLSVCLARNENTTSHPFISALELELLEGSVYNSTKFTEYALSTVARTTFGDDSSNMISFPDDQFNRLWQPYKDQNPVVNSHFNVTSSDFWNIPPVKAFASAITTSQGKSLQIKWPPVSLPSSRYYIALYFQDSRTPSPFSWRVFSVSINGNDFYKDVNATTKGVTVTGSEWPLSGQTEITLTPHNNTLVGPIINAAEIFQILPLGGRTHTRDGSPFLFHLHLYTAASSENQILTTLSVLCYIVISMELLANNFKNPPSDWIGDPCLPYENSWTGVTCSKDKLARVITL
ncbi:hypothetical protein LWI28_020091 [Acer negundo]|uniref:Malectin-like domain-containing protein n=1 Tax=Acer negundo TaxID=4023 RepID=A0AAD5J195_ACENE|nr:hypothetical protein LWI28_020091 [Acer negundo]